VLHGLFFKALGSAGEPCSDFRHALGGPLQGVVGERIVDRDEDVTGRALFFRSKAVDMGVVEDLGLGGAHLASAGANAFHDRVDQQIALQRFHEVLFVHACVGQTGVERRFILEAGLDLGKGAVDGSRTQAHATCVGTGQDGCLDVGMAPGHPGGLDALFAAERHAVLAVQGQRSLEGVVGVDRGHALRAS
jgi:hypothetical protein